MRPSTIRIIVYVIVYIVVDKELLGPVGALAVIRLEIIWVGLSILCLLVKHPLNDRDHVGQITHLRLLVEIMASERVKIWPSFMLVGR